MTALDGVTGEIKWQFDPKAEDKNPYYKRCRTLGYYDPGPGDQCGPRVVLTTVDTRLISLKASDGKPCETFGQGGSVDLSIGMGQWTPADPLNENQDVPTIPGYAYMIEDFWSPIRIPCLEPPWGTVSAVDLASGKLIWQHPAGTSQDFTLQGVEAQPGIGFYVGMPALGGPITTASGVTFHSGTQDYYLRAYATETGKLLWQGRLPTGSQATPMTYIGKDGRQYVVLTASGARDNPKDWGDYIVAFALPKSK